MSFELYAAGPDDYERGRIRIKPELYDASIEFSSNWNVGKPAGFAGPEAMEERLIWVETQGAKSFTISRDEAEALRDRLTLILNAHDEANPREEENDTADSTTIVSDVAVDAMQELAHQLSVFYNSELIDALDRHTDALNNFNK